MSSIANILSLSASAVNIPTGSFVQMSAATPITTSQIVLVNTTSQIVIVAVGAAGSEVGLVAVAPSSQLLFQLGTILPAGSRIALQAIGSSASSGYVTASLYP